MSKLDLFVLTFKPTNKDYVGNHLVRLTLSDDQSAETTYLFNMIILPLINIGAPFFNPVPDEMSLRVALGEKISLDFNYPTDDPDPEDKDILQSFKIPTSLSQFLTYDPQTKILKCAIPLIKPPSITLNKLYPLLITLNDKNPAGPKETPYTFMIEVYDRSPAQAPAPAPDPVPDPAPASSKIDV